MPGLLKTTTWATLKEQEQAITTTIKQSKSHIMPDYADAYNNMGTVLKEQEVKPIRQ